MRRLIGMRNGCYANFQRTINKFDVTPLNGALRYDHPDVAGILKNTSARFVDSDFRFEELVLGKVLEQEDEGAVVGILKAAGINIGGFLRSEIWLAARDGGEMSTLWSLPDTHEPNATS